jgi:hypothetical protein
MGVLVGLENPRNSLKPEMASKPHFDQFVNEENQKICHTVICNSPGKKLFKILKF